MAAQKSTCSSSVSNCTTITKQRSSLSSLIVVFLLIVIGVVVRAIGFIHDGRYVHALMQRPDIITPATDFTRVKEGVYFLRHGMPLYDNSIIHQPPLLMRLFDILLNVFSIPVIFISVDVLLAVLLYAIVRRIRLSSIVSHCSNVHANFNADLLRLARNEDMPAAERDAGVSLVLYLFSPYSIMSCIGCSTVVFCNVPIIAALYEGISGRLYSAISLLAVAAYVGGYPLLLLLPLAMVVKQTNPVAASKHPLWFGIQVTIIFTITLSMLGYASVVMIGTDDFWNAVRNVYEFQLLAPELRPNMGLFWYFFLEMFDHFRPFFVAVLQLHIVSFVIPLSTRLRDWPVLLYVVVFALTGILKPYPSVGDMASALALLAGWSYLFHYVRFSLLTVSVLAFVFFLAPSMWHIWVSTGTGNANFFYAIGLVYTLSLLLLFGDVTQAALKFSFDLRHGHVISKEVILKSE